MAPTSHAILGQVPGVDLGYILTDFLNKRRRRKLLGGVGAAPPGMFEFFTLQRLLSWVSKSFRQDIGKCSTFFHLKYIYI